MPELFIITGPNGAGKSSNAASLLPSICNLPVFDGDKLYYQFLDKHYQLTKVTKLARERAGEELDNVFNFQIQNALALKLDYAYEGHFTSQNSWSTVRLFRDHQYSVNLIFLALDSVELSMQRVAFRVSNGGHHVPPRSIVDNFFGNMKMVDAHLDLIDNLKIIDNSGLMSNHILTVERNNITYLIKKSPPIWMKKGMPNLMTLLKKTIK